MTLFLKNAGRPNGCMKASMFRMSEVGIDDDSEGWSPYLSVEDAYRLDEVRAALRRVMSMPPRDWRGYTS